MKKIQHCLLAAVLALSLPALSHASQAGGAENAFSIGVGLGDPTGIELGFWFDNQNWLDIGLGTAGFSSAVLYITYHMLLAEIETKKSDVFKFGFSLGIGGLVGGGGRAGYWGGRDNWGDRRFNNNYNNNLRFGARVPLGLEFWFMKIPLSLFFQIGPQLTNYFPHDIITGQVGARFHFRAKSQR